MSRPRSSQPQACRLKSNSFSAALSRATTIVLLLLSLAYQATAAQIIIVNLDAPGEGLNDPTPAAPVGGNPGTTVGQQRLNVLEHAAHFWGDRLASSVPIRVGARFDSL